MRPRALIPSVVPSLGLVLALAPALPGCGGCGADEGDDEPSEPGTQQASGGEAQGGEASGEASDDSDPGPPPVVRVGAEPADTARGFVPIVQSRGDEPAMLGREVAVERKNGDEWSEVATVSLRFSCDEPPKDECVTLVPGAELRPPAWRAKEGDDAQCDGGGKPAPAGTYRFVAKSCGGAHTLPGEPFAR